MKEFSTPVMIVGNAPHLPSYMAPYLPRMPLIALDGGLHFIEEAGEVAELLIGDMDSISSRNHRAAREVIALSEQDHNDFEKALYSVRAPLMVGRHYLVVGQISIMRLCISVPNITVNSPSSYAVTKMWFWSLLDEQPCHWKQAVFVQYCRLRPSHLRSQTACCGLSQAKSLPSAGLYHHQMN